MAIEYNFTLDMDRSKRDNNIAYARTGDVDSIVINADLVFNGAAYTPTGTNAFFECVTPNGHSIRTAAEKTGSSVSVEVPSAAFQAAGVINVAYFRFESGSSDNPTYVESTEPFAIVVREGIGDNIDAGDYIEEWRQLADRLEAIVSEVEQKAEQAETAIDEQKTEVDQLKAQAQVSIAGDVTEVEDAAQSAITAINQEKADVADAAEGVSAAGKQAINQFNTNGTSAINQFNTNADAKLDEVDGMITEAQGDVDAAITQLESKTQEAIDAAQDALDGTTATNLQNAINRTLKLDVADMVVIPDNSSLSSFTNVGSYCCKTAATATTIGDCPIDDSPFNMYVFSSGTSGQVMQLVVPIDLNSKPTAEWHVRFGTSSAMDPWSVIGGGADIAAGLGIDVTGDAQKTVALDTTAFYQHHDATDIIQGSTEVTGGGRVKELTVFGSTRQNLWVNPSGTSNGVTVTSNADGSVTISGTSTGNFYIWSTIYSLKPGSTYTLSIDNAITADISIQAYNSDGYISDIAGIGIHGASKNTAVFPQNATYARLMIQGTAGRTPSGTYRVMLNEGSEAEPWCPPGLNGVDELSVVCAGKNLFGISQEFGDLSGWASTQLYDEGDGWVRAEASSGAIGIWYKKNKIRFMPATYTLSFEAYANKRVTVGYNYIMESEEGNVVLKSKGAVVPTVTTEKQRISLSFTLDVELNGSLMIGIGDAGSQGTEFHVRNVQLELGSTATAYEPPTVTTTPIDLDGHTLNSLPDGTCDELRIDGTGAVTLTKRVGSYVADGDEGWKLSASGDAPYRMKVDSWKADVLNNTLSYDEFLSTVLPASGINYYYNGSYIIINGRYQLYAGRTGITTADAFSEWLKTSPMTVLYPLATPQEVELPGVSMPDLASPSYTVFASSNVPAEIEAEVVKVDYLPPSDVYTKEEVDKKIKDAGGMPDIVPVSQGGTGVTTAAAERNRLGLGNTTGALPVANGGTGATTAKVAQYNLLNSIDTEDGNPEDTSLFTFAYVSPSSTNGVLYKRTGSNVWSWIASKIRSTFGFNSSNVLPVSHGGTGLTDNPSILVNLESGSATDVLASSPRPGVTGTLPVSHGGTGATAPGVDMLSNLGITFGTADPPSTGTPGSIYIQYFE
jgi:hypothetical protein